DDSELGEAFPGSPEWAVYLSRPGYLNYDIDFTSPLCNITNTEPMATDFILKFDDLEVMGGEHTSINVNDIDEHTLQINGKDWLNYLDTLTWPFDPDHPLDNPYVQADYDTGQMVNDLLVEILGQTYVPTFTYQLTLTGVVSDYRIEPGDQESLLAKITNLSQIEPGFDFD